MTPASGGEAPRSEHVDILHGVAVPDPYRAMENTRDPSVRAWMLEQGELARKTLDALPERESLLQRIQALDEQQGDAVHSISRVADGRLFYLKRARGERQFKLVMRQGFAATEQVLFDPDEMAHTTGTPHAINYFVPSWDGRHVAYGVSAGGSEDASLYLMRVADRQVIHQPIPRVETGSVSWLPDSQSFTYNQLKQLKPGEPETEYYMDSRVLWQRLGQSAASAKPVFGPTVTRQLGLRRLDVGKIIFSPDSPWMLARTTDTTVPEGFLFVARVADLGRSSVPWRRVSKFDDRIVQVELKGNDAYLMTYANAPRYRVLRLDLRRPVLAQAQEVALPPAEAVLQSFSFNRDALVASVREGTAIGLRLYHPGDRVGVPVPLPYVGAATLQSDMSRAFPDVLYTLSGWNQPPRLWLFGNERTSEVSLKDSPAVRDVLDVEVREVLAPSHDGAMVPMTILHRRGLPAGAPHPTLLIGYGAYGMTQTARFSVGEQAWMERGGVLAFANVRGSGVYGQDWYRAGFKSTKSNTWKDGIACARYLIAQGYTSPAALAVSGGSAGGIFAGRALTEAPELFAAAVVHVGVLDAVRAEESANGITNISEFGSAHNAHEFPFVLEMSAYHHVKDGVAYPAVMLLHGMNDPRVDVWHSAKMAARLQAASSSGKPVLLRLDAKAGHGVGNTQTQQQAISADVYGFLLMHLLAK